MLRLAILSPSITNNVETFVRSHINGINANVFFYYGDFVPRFCEGIGAFSIDKGSLKHPWSIAKRILRINPIKYKVSGLNIFEYLFTSHIFVTSHNINYIILHSQLQALAPFHLIFTQKNFPYS